MTSQKSPWLLSNCRVRSLSRFGTEEGIGTAISGDWGALRRRWSGVGAPPCSGALHGGPGSARGGPWRFGHMRQRLCTWRCCCYAPGRRRWQGRTAARPPARPASCLVMAGQLGLGLAMAAGRSPAASCLLCSAMRGKGAGRRGLLGKGEGGAWGAGREGRRRGLGPAAALPCLALLCSAPKTERTRERYREDETERARG